MCLEELEKTSKSQLVSARYNRGKYAGSASNRRFSVGAVCESVATAGRPKPRTNSFSEASHHSSEASCPKFWVSRGPERRPLGALPTNCDKRGGDTSPGPPRKISRHSDGTHNTRVHCSDSTISTNHDEDFSDCDTENAPVLSRRWPRPLSLTAGEAAALPTVVVTPESPPLLAEMREVQTLYRPGDEATVQTRVVTSDTPFHAENSLLEKEISAVLGVGGAVDRTDNSIVICGRNNSITKTCFDILPGLGPVSLPFGETSISEEAVEERELASGPVTVSQSTTSLSQGTVHYLRDIGDGTISIATTTYCGIQHSVTTPSKGAQPSSKSTTVLYSVNRKPVICENPFRRVFTKRKQFYQERERNGRPASPETSSKKLIWRQHGHTCGQDTLAPPSTLVDTGQTPTKFFTLNANIQPFDPFIIKHSLPCLDPSPSCASVNLTLCGETDSNQPSVQLLPDGSGLKYLARVEEDGGEASLEVSVKRDQSTITTLRTGTSDCTSNEISVRLVDGGNMVNIQQSQSSFPRPEAAPVRPSSLHIPSPKYATARPAKSVCQGRGTSPCTSPRYNSLPNLKGVMYENYARDPTWGYQSHPKDEERKLAFTRGEKSEERRVPLFTAVQRLIRFFLTVLFSPKTNNHHPLRESQG
jgi:hypothetical protein